MRLLALWTEDAVEMLAEDEEGSEGEEGKEGGLDDGALWRGWGGEEEGAMRAGAGVQGVYGTACSSALLAARLPTSVRV
jgi:hypothetical protein